jgi:hypothetical protein
VTVSGVDVDLNGTYVISARTANTISYAKVTANVVSTAVTSANAIVKVVSSTSTTQYNVPGNVYYNPDITVDRVIRSNEDPTS